MGQIFECSRVGVDPFCQESLFNIRYPKRIDDPPDECLTAVRLDAVKLVQVLSDFDRFLIHLFRARNRSVLYRVGFVFSFASQQKKRADVKDESAFLQEPPDNLVALKASGGVRVDVVVKVPVLLGGIQGDDVVDVRAVDNLVRDADVQLPASFDSMLTVDDLFALIHENRRTDVSDSLDALLQFIDVLRVDDSISLDQLEFREVVRKLDA